MNVAGQRRKAIGRAAVGIIIVIVIAAAGVAAYYATNLSNTSPTTSTSAVPTSTATVSHTTTNRTLVPVTLSLDFAPSSYHALWYYPVDKGIYAQNGLQVTIEPASNPGQAVSEVATGKVDFAQADLGSLVTAWAKGATNIVAVGVVYHSNPSTVFYIQGKGISNLKDLEGKTWGSFLGSTSALDFIYVAKLNGLNLSKITVNSATAATLPTLLVTGKVDFITLTANRIADIGNAAQQAGLQLGYFLEKNYGLSRYNVMLITNTNMTTNHPDRVRAFVNASYYGEWQAIQNPAAATSSLIKSVPSLPYNISLTGLRAIINNSVYPIPAQSSQNPLYMGWMDPSQMQSSVALIQKAYNINATINVSSIYTNQFVAMPP